MKLSKLAQHINARLQGDPDLSVTAPASLTDAGPQHLSFALEPRFFHQVENTRAAAVIVPENFSGAASCALLFAKDVHQALEQVLLLFAEPDDLPDIGIHPSACVAPDAQLGNQVAVGPHVTIGKNVIVGDRTVIKAGCVIERGVRIGINCYLAAHVVINHDCLLGNNVIIHAHCTIGTDGFGYRLLDGQHHKIPHIGIVVIEDDVEIGANTCIDRAKFGRTLIGSGTKIDNLVQIAHNVKVGEHCIIVSQAGLAGSSELGKYVVLGGQCGLSDHVKLGDGVMAGGQCGVYTNVEPGARILGSPHRPYRDFFREFSLIQKLPQLAQDVKKLRNQVAQSATPENHS